MYKLITGSNGFIGNHYREKSKEKNVIYGSISSKNKDNFIFKPQYEDIEEVLDGYEVETIIHMASIIPNSYDSSDYNLFIRNIDMFNNIYNYCLKHKVKKLIYISSFGSMTDLSDLDIKDFYTMSKIVGEHYCKMLSNKGVNTIILRLPSPYGVGGNENSVIHKFINLARSNKDITIFNNGEREQNFVNIKDVLQAINLSEKYNGSGTFDIVDERVYNMRDLAEIIIDLTNSKSEIKSIFLESEKFKNRIEFNIDHSHKILGYYPNVSLENGIKEMII